MNSLIRFLIGLVLYSSLALGETAGDFKKLPNAKQPGVAQDLNAEMLAFRKDFLTDANGEIGENVRIDTCNCKARIQGTRFQKLSVKRAGLSFKGFMVQNFKEGKGWEFHVAPLISVKPSISANENLYVADALNGYLTPKQWLEEYKGIGWKITPPDSVNAEGEEALDRATYNEVPAKNLNALIKGELDGLQPSGGTLEAIRVENIRNAVLIETQRLKGETDLIEGGEEGEDDLISKVESLSDANNLLKSKVLVGESNADKKRKINNNFDVPLSKRTCRR